MRLTMLVLLITLTACNSLPKEQFNLFEWDKPLMEYSEDDATVNIHLHNPVHCPILVNVSTKLDSAKLKNQLANTFPLILPPMLADTILRFTGSGHEGESVLNWSIKYTQGTDSVRADSFFLPYPYGKSYSVMQGYNGSFSHDNDGARYAIDFTLAVGDTVCAAADGYVVGVIEGYEKGGSSSEWMNYANFINLYHPSKNVYTQYVHLQHNGSLVEVGDRVLAGQPIGISGQTGWTSKPHLHFNVVRMEEGKRVSQICTFGQKRLMPGSEFRKGDRHQNLISRTPK